MYLNNIDFPNEIIDAIKENRLVVFAGAGISMGKPTCLPSFVELAKEIACGTGEKFNDDKESAEVFLGNLKYRGIKVNELVAEKLSKNCLQPNEMHRALINLFVDSSGIKIVTTNYDQMFEKVLKERNLEGSYRAVPIYDIPAIPLGNDFNGIIHLHGNISNPQYMVLTDEEFGKAYLTEGYATRFLVQLFNEYTILFIGYSYNDIILRYLTRAMSRNATQQKYIMTHEDKDSWETLGIKAISFPFDKKRGKDYGDYESERQGLQELGSRIKRGLLDWKYYFSKVATSPQKDLTSDSEIDYCLNKYETSMIMADCISGKEWLKCLNEKSVFDNLFNKMVKLNDRDKLWADWLIKYFLVDKDGEIIKIYKKKSEANDEFSQMIIRELSACNQDISLELFTQYLFIFGKRIDDKYCLLRLIDKCKSNSWFDLQFKLFIRMFVFSFEPKKNYWREGYELNHSFNCDCYSIESTWKKSRELFIERYAYELMTSLQRIVKDIAFGYKSMGYDEPWDLIYMVDEDNHHRNLEDDHFYMIRSILEECAKRVEQDNTKAIELFIIDSLESKSILLKRLAIKLISDSATIKESKKVETVLKRVPLSLRGIKTPIRKLIKQSYENIGEPVKRMLFKHIDAYSAEIGDEEYNQQQIFNWYIWLQTIDKNNKYIKERIESIKGNYPNFESYEGFKESRFMKSHETVYEDKSPKSVEELLLMDSSDVVLLISEYEDDYSKRYSRGLLLENVSRACKKDYKWGKKIVNDLLNNGNGKEDIWNCLLRGLESSDFSIVENISIIHLMINKILIFESKTIIADYLWKTINKEGFKEYFYQHRESILSYLDCLWQNRDATEVEGDNIYFYCINSSLGILLKCYVLLLVLDSDDNIHELIKKRFEESLNFEGDERRVSICILAGCYILLSIRDKEWCFEKIIPYLSTSIDTDYADAWGGIVYLSRRVSEDLLNEWESTYLKAIKQIRKLPKEIRNEFVDIYTTIVVNVSKDPIGKFIPAFINNSDADSKRRFAFEMNHRLMTMSDENKKILWNRWLRIYFENRNNGIPRVLTNDDRCEMLEWLVELEPVYDEAVEIICRGEPPKKTDGRFWYAFMEKKYAQNNPKSTVKLLVFIMKDKNSIGYSESYVRQIYMDLPTKYRESNKQLDEALLRCGIKDCLN